MVKITSKVDLRSMVGSGEIGSGLHPASCQMVLDLVA